jgi:hypothetical protein
MKLLPESEAAKAYKTFRSIEDIETQRRIMSLAKQQRIAAQEAELLRRVGNQKRWIRPRMTISALDYIHFIQTHSAEEAHSEEFIKYHIRKHPEQRVTRH